MMNYGCKVLWPVFCIIILMVCGCETVHVKKPDSFDDDEAKVIQFIGSIKKLWVNNESYNNVGIPEDVIGIKTRIQLYSSDIGQFSGILNKTQFKLSSMHRKLQLDMVFIDEDTADRVNGTNREKGIILLEWVGPDSADDEYEGKISEAKACLRIWNEGEKCFLEFVETGGMTPTPSTSGS
jgi:hypothetical protein